MPRMESPLFIFAATDGKRRYTNNNRDDVDRIVIEKNQLFDLLLAAHFSAAIPKEAIADAEAMNRMT